MADFPIVGASEDTWGDELVEFFKQEFFRTGSLAGSFAIVCNEGQVVTNQNQVVVNSGEQE